MTLSAQTLSPDELLKLSFEDLFNIKIQSAEKTTHKIKDIPASIIVISREDIETYGYHSIEDIIADIPGFYSWFLLSGNPPFVGGELIPLDTTSLLLAGAQMNAAWMIPVIVAGIGFAIVIARKF